MGRGRGGVGCRGGIELRREPSDRHSAGRLVVLIGYIVSGLHKEDKQKIKQLLYHHLPDLYFTSRGELSDDEGDNDEGTVHSSKCNFYYGAVKVSVTCVYACPL